MNTFPIDVHYQQAVQTVRFGGGTFARDAARNAALPYRYIVALGKPHTRIVHGTNASLIARALRELADTRAAWAGSHDNRALGTWLDTTDGRVYIDVVESIANRDKALQIAKERGELAIFDTVAGDEIRVDADYDKAHNL